MQSTFEEAITGTTSDILDEEVEEITTENKKRTSSRI